MRSLLVVRRREFLKGASATTAAAALGGCEGDGPGSGDAPATDARDVSHPRELPAYPGEHDDRVAHLLPTVNHQRLLLKCSLKDAPDDPPVLWIDDRPVDGLNTDKDGRFFLFDAAGLDPDTSYTLSLTAGAQHLIDPWPVRTFPAPDQAAERLRMLVFTCPGGNDFLGLQLPLSIRHRFIERGLSFEPDVALVIGDHVYWDLRAGLGGAFLGGSDRAIEWAGEIDFEAPALGGANEDVLKKAVGPQIAELYGTRFRGLPSFFIRDDHDYFENDEYREEIVTFPPDAASLRLARASQWLYYPEFLPDAARPTDLPDASAADRPQGIAEAFGTLRYGDLLEALLYDCKGFLTLDGEQAVMVPPAVEAWLRNRMAESSARHVVNVPSNPPGWSAGKFAEWYPDSVNDEGLLTTDTPKPGWQSGWMAQHDRLLAAASAMPRIPLFLSGDIHSHAEGRILRSRDTDLSANPVVSVIVGTPGTNDGAWPSFFRGTVATPSSELQVEEALPALEENGFNIVDFDRDSITIRSFRWDKETMGEDEIDALEPFRVTTLTRPTS